MYGAALAASIGLSLVSWEGYCQDGRSVRYGNNFESILATNGNGIMPASKGLLLPESLNARVSRVGISSWSPQRAAEIFLFMHWVQTVARATHRAIDRMNATP